MRVVGSSIEEERSMMTEVQFLDRFQRKPSGEWACTKPINVNGPRGPVVIPEGTTFVPGALFLGLISRRNSMRWLRSIARVRLKALSSRTPSSVGHSR